MDLRGEYPSTGSPLVHNENGPLEQQQQHQQPSQQHADGSGNDLQDAREDVVSDEGVEKDQPSSLEASNAEALSPDSGADEPAASLGRPPSVPPALESQKSTDSAASGGAIEAVGGAAGIGGACANAAESDAEQASPAEPVDAAAAGPPPAGAGAGAEPDDQYRIYFYDSKLPLNSRSLNQGGSGHNHHRGRTASSSLSPSLDLFRNLRRTVDDPWETLFMRAEGLHAHGYHVEACALAVRLAHHLLKNPPDLTVPSLYGSGSHGHGHGYGNVHGYRIGSSSTVTSGANESHKTEGGAASSEVALPPPPLSLGVIPKVNSIGLVCLYEQYKN